MNPFLRRGLQSTATALLPVLLCAVAISACQRQPDQIESKFGAGAVVGANYSDNGIQWFTVDGAGGSPLGTYTGGGAHVCCAKYPKTWTPDFKVSVKWARSDGRKANGTEWKIKTLEKVISVPKYPEEGNVYVLFYPDDEVKVFVSVVGVGNPDFPTRPGYPEHAEKILDAQEL